jgi:leucyl aminopeptidase
MERAIQVKAVQGRVAASWGDAVAVPVLKGKGAPRSAAFKDLDKALKGGLTDLVGLGDFAGNGDEVRVLYSRSSAVPNRVILLGIGDGSSLTPEKARRAGGKLAKTLQELKIKRVTLVGIPQGAGLDVHRLTGALVEGVLLGSYRYDDFKTRDVKPVHLRTLNVAPENGADLKHHQNALNHIAAACEASLYTRDIANRPANDLTPTTLAQTARQLAQEFGMKVTVLDYKKAEAEGMHAFCGVAKGSNEPPAFIVLEYWGGPKGQPPIALVGKGLTFDSGGISLKPAENMDHMKFDMCGAAAVLGALRAVGSVKLNRNVVGIIPSVENMPGGRAYKPGDVLKTLGGPTIEVRNTDAEGRVVLADALAYAGRFTPEAVIDLATLTGGCVIALGNEAAGLFSNDRDLARRILASGEETGERCWELPLWDDYREIVKSDVADLRNATGRPASAITAACFLLAFAEKYRWAHLDIAGTAYTERNLPYAPKGATGFGVRLLLHLLEHWPAGRDVSMVRDAASGNGRKELAAVSRAAAVASSENGRRRTSRDRDAVGVGFGGAREKRSSAVGLGGGRKRRSR